MSAGSRPFGASSRPLGGACIPGGGPPPPPPPLLLEPPDDPLLSPVEPSSSRAACPLSPSLNDPPPFPLLSGVLSLAVSGGAWKPGAGSLLLEPPDEPPLSRLGAGLADGSPALLDPLPPLDPLEPPEESSVDPSSRRAARPLSPLDSPDEPLSSEPPDESPPDEPPCLISRFRVCAFVSSPELLPLLPLLC